MAEGVDVSEHQGILEPSWFAQYDFAILRAFNENGLWDSTFTRNWANAKGQCRRGVYGWPIAGGDNAGLGASLVDVAPDAELGYWGDYEKPPGRPLASAGELEDYLGGIEGRGGSAGFYSNIPECPRTPSLDATPWWMADYDVNDGTRHDPNRQPPVPARDWVIHQYSSAGGLDRNYAPTLDFFGGFLMALTPDQEYLIYLVANYIANGTWENGRVAPSDLNVRLADIRAACGGSGAAGSGLTAEEVRAVVREELNRTHLAG